VVEKVRRESKELTGARLVECCTDEYNRRFGESSVGAVVRNVVVEVEMSLDFFDRHSKRRGRGIWRLMIRTALPKATILLAFSA